MPSTEKYNIIALSLIALAIIYITSLTPLYQNLNNSIYDLFLTLNKSDTPNNSIIIVKIDYQSIQKIGRWPWKRDIYSDFIDVLKKNKASLVAFYLDFSMPDTPESDHIFTSKLKDFPTVSIDPYVFRPEGFQSQHWENIKNYSKLGHDLLRTDKDQVVRNQSFLLNNKPSFALSVLNLYDQEKHKIVKNNTDVIIHNKIYRNINNKKIPISFKRPWYLFNSYSFIDVLDGKIPPSILKNKIILVGMTKQKMVEYITTPFSKKFVFSGNNAPIYVQAQIIDSLLSNNIIKAIEFNHVFLLLFLIIPVMIITTKKLNTFRQIIMLVLVIPILFILFTFGLFKYFNLWISPALLIFSSVVIFITLTINLIFNISNKLDAYIQELSNRTNVEKVNEFGATPTVDKKLEALKEITAHIEEDRSTFDNILSSVNSIIILFNKEGEILYSNSSSKKIDSSDFINHLDIPTIINKLEIDVIYQEKVFIKNKTFEFNTNKAKENLYVGVFNDITNMVKINQMKTNIVRMLSHEMKTPLASILLYTDYLLRAEELEKYNNYVTNISTQTEFLKDLIDTFLELNKIETAEYEILKKQLDITKLLKDVIESFTAIAQDKKIKIETKFMEEIPEIQADDNYLIILFKNLLDNAIKYSPEETTITISCRIRKKDLVISFKDQGYGIPEKDLNNLFDNFYRVKTEKTTEIKGSGLGLSFVKKIVELHDGNITVQSKFGEGSIFTITLPVEQQ